MQRERQDFQQRMDRGVQTCNDEVRDMVPAGTTSPSPELMTKLQNAGEKCMLKVIKAHSALLPSVEKRIAGNLSSIAAQAK